MLEQKEKNKGGRPKLELNEDEIFKLARIGCTIAEIADWFECSKDVLERRYSGIIKKGRTEVKMSIRRAQLKLALENHHPSMLIFLGKVMLGQVEPKYVETTENSPEGIDFEVVNEK